MPKGREELSVMKGIWGDLFLCVEKSSLGKRLIYPVGDQDLKIMITGEENKMREKK